MAPKAKKSSPKPSPATVEARPQHDNEESSQRAHETAASLIAALISGTTVTATVETILKKYREEDADGTLCAIINTVCKASGVQEVEIDPATLRQEGNIVATLEELFARVPLDSAAYLIVNRDAKYKRFRKTFPDFFERLVGASYAGDVLFDETFFPTILQWLLPMTESKARSFRHTATVAILSMIQGLNERIGFLKDTIQSLKKKEASVSQTRLATLMELQDHIFTTAVHQRIKDVAPEIRLVVLQTLHHLCVASPDHYVANRYLRYFSIALVDKKPELRLEGLEAMTDILGNHPTHASRMRDFLKFFANRLVEMVNDIDSKCANHAIKLCALIVKCDSDSGATEDTLSNSMIDFVLGALFDDRSGIRSSAGTFLKMLVRCRVGDDENATQLRAELLCTFVSIFRDSYGHEQPEKYLVDALWRADHPPAILVEYKPILGIIRTGEGHDVVTALAIIAALLSRIQAPLLFGAPNPKDDVKNVIKATDANHAEGQALRVKISKDVITFLRSALENYGDSVPVLCAVANVLSSIDLHVFTTTKESENLCETFSLFRKAVATLPIVDRISIEHCTAAWYAIAFTEYPQQETAKVELNSFVKQTLLQLQSSNRSTSTRSSQDASQSSKSVADLEQVWARIQILSALIPLKDQWAVVKNALGRYTNGVAAASTLLGASQLLSKIIPVAAQSLLWQRAELEVDPSINPQTVIDETAEVLEMLLRVASWESDGSRHEPGTLEVRTDALSYFADLAAFPTSVVSQAQQELLIETATEIFDALETEQRESSLGLKGHVTQAAKETSSFDPKHLGPTMSARAVVSKWEGSLARVAMVAARLFSFMKVSDKLAPQCLLLWTRSHVKTVADTFKALFHTIRDRSPDAFGFEKDLLLAAYKQCAEQGSNGSAVEALYQVGLKLSSMHFVPTDKHYPVCVNIVRFGVDFAATVDPTILNAISPFCARLRQADALSIANSLHHHEVFLTSTSTYAQAFVTAIRRAAKLEDAAPSANVSTTPWRSSKKRPREVTAPRDEQPDELLAEITKSASRQMASAPSPTSGRKTNKASAKPSAAAARTTTADGWRVRVDDEALLSQASAIGTPAVYGTQESVALSSMLADLDQEVMIATQEFE